MSKVALELRPSWCLPGDSVSQLISIGPWQDESGSEVSTRDGDDWTPGEPLLLSRELSLVVDPIDLRRDLGLRAGAAVEVGVRWSCRATALAGVHNGGPSGLDLTNTNRVVVEIPPTVAGAVELETCVVVRWPHGSIPHGGVPDGGLVWSDSWDVAQRERMVLLEGSEVRIPVRNASFAGHYGEPSSALWAIDLDPSIEPDDLVSNVVTVLLNLDVLEREFRDIDDTPDPSQIPKAALAGISVDLVRSLTSVLLDDLEDADHWHDYSEGSVGAMLAIRLAEAFGSPAVARVAYLEDHAGFSRRLWDLFAPDQWKA